MSDALRLPTIEVGSEPRNDLTEALKKAGNGASPSYPAYWGPFSIVGKEQRDDRRCEQKCCIRAYGAQVTATAGIIAPAGLRLLTSIGERVAA